MYAIVLRERVGEREREGERERSEGGREGGRKRESCLLTVAFHTQLSTKANY